MAKASWRVFSQSWVRMVMLPPTMVCRPAPRVAKMLRERTTMPRTTAEVADDAVAGEFERGGDDGGVEGRGWRGVGRHR